MSEKCSQPTSTFGDYIQNMGIYALKRCLLSKAPSPYCVVLQPQCINIVRVCVPAFRVYLKRFHSMFYRFSWVVGVALERVMWRLRSRREHPVMYSCLRDVFRTGSQDTAVNAQHYALMHSWGNHFTRNSLSLRGFHGQFFIVIFRFPCISRGNGSALPGIIWETMNIVYYSSVITSKSR